MYGLPSIMMSLIEEKLSLLAGKDGKNLLPDNPCYHGN